MLGCSNEALLKVKGFNYRSRRPRSTIVVKLLEALLIVVKKVLELRSIVVEFSEARLIVVKSPGTWIHDRGGILGSTIDRGESPGARLIVAKSPGTTMVTSGCRHNTAVVYNNSKGDSAGGKERRKRV